MLFYFEGLGSCFLLLNSQATVNNMFQVEQQKRENFKKVIYLRGKSTYKSTVQISAHYTECQTLNFKISRCYGPNYIQHNATVTNADAQTCFYNTGKQALGLLSAHSRGSPPYYCCCCCGYTDPPSYIHYYPYCVSHSLHFNLL